MTAEGSTERTLRLLELATEDGIFAALATGPSRRFHDALAEVEGGTPCQQAGRARRRWFDESSDRREQAVLDCRSSCPVLDLCHAYADAAGEQWGVWGGVDRERQQHQAGRAHLLRLPAAGTGGPAAATDHLV